MNMSQRTSETYDKENPPHPIVMTKKHSLTDEPIARKVALGENTQLIQTETVEE